MVLEILGGPFRSAPPLVLGVGTKTLDTTRVKNSKIEKSEVIGDYFLSHFTKLSNFKADTKETCVRSNFYWGGGGWSGGEQ